jgi:hypothetical protein
MYLFVYADPSDCTYGYALAQGRRDYMEDRCVARKVGVRRCFCNAHVLIKMCNEYVIFLGTNIHEYT